MTEIIIPDNNKDGTSFGNLNYIPGRLLFLTIEIKYLNLTKYRERLKVILFQ